MEIVLALLAALILLWFVLRHRRAADPLGDVRYSQHGLEALQHQIARRQAGPAAGLTPATDWTNMRVLGSARTPLGGSSAFGPPLRLKPPVYESLTFEPGTFEPGTFEPGTFEPATLEGGRYKPGRYKAGRYRPGKYRPGRYRPGRLTP